MKKLVKGSKDSSVMGATIKGTTFYKTSLSQIIDALSGSDANVWILKSFEELGLGAIDLNSSFPGSIIVNNDLFICKTDGEEIEINGKMVDPEDAEWHCKDESDLAPYIQQATPEMIIDGIGPLEIKMPLFDKWAIDLLEGGHSFLTIAEAADEFKTDEY